MKKYLRMSSAAVVIGALRVKKVKHKLKASEMKKVEFANSLDPDS